MTWTQSSLFRLSSRYPAHYSVVQLSRVYIRDDMRRKAIGNKLVQLAEQCAADFGYDVIYLHADRHSAAAIRF